MQDLVPETVGRLHSKLQHRLLWTLISKIFIILNGSKQRLRYGSKFLLLTYMKLLQEEKCVFFRRSNRSKGFAN